MLRARHLLPAAAIAAGLATAGQASAATYCVHQPGTACAAGEIDRGTNLQLAMSDAGTTPDADEVRIGPGTYPSPAGGFHANSQSPLTVKGSGSSTVLTSQSSPAILVSGNTLRDVAVQIAPNANAIGVKAIFGGGVVNTTITGSADNAKGVQAIGPSELFGLTIGVVGTFSTGISIQEDGGETPSIMQSTITAQTPIRVFGVGTPDRFAIDRVTTYGPEGIHVTDGYVTVRNSAMHLGTGGFAPLRAECVTSNVRIDADHLTILGPGSEVALRSKCDVAQHVSTVSVTNSTIHGFAFLTERYASGVGAQAYISLNYSDATPGSSSDAGLGSVSISSPVVVADPQFADVDGHLKATSPLIDAADPMAAFSQFVPDRDGLVRLSGAAQDVGAYEFQVPVVVPPADPGTGGGNGGGGTGSATTTAGSGDVTPADGPATTPMVPVPTTDPARPAAPAPAVTAAQLRAALRAAIKTGARGTHTLRWPTAGRVTFEWRVHGRVVARGTATRTSAGRTRVTVKRLHALPRHARVAVRATFTPAAGGGAPVTVSSALAR